IRTHRAGILGISLRPLVRHYLREGAFQQISVYGMLCVPFVRRIKAAGLRVQCFLDYNENQWMDRGLHLGFSKYSPETCRIAYQPWVPSRNHFNLYLTALEVRSAIAPRAIASSRAGAKALVRF